MGRVNPGVGAVFARAFLATLLVAAGGCPDRKDNAAAPGPGGDAQPARPFKVKGSAVPPASVDAFVAALSEHFAPVGGTYCGAKGNSLLELRIEEVAVSDPLPLDAADRLNGVEEIRSLTMSHAVRHLSPYGQWDGA